jgi:hypothetical protein
MSVSSKGPARLGAKQRRALSEWRNGPVGGRTARHLIAVPVANGPYAVFAKKVKLLLEDRVSETLDTADTLETEKKPSPAKAGLFDLA